jgi:hypothetical protein
MSASPEKTNMKTYNQFSDVNGNEYTFANYMDFATWFFGKSRKFLVTYFAPDVFKKLQYAAANSKEARTKI